MAGVGQCVWEAYQGVGEAVWIAYQGVGDAVWFAHQGVGDAVWIAYQGVGRAVWAAACFPASELIHVSDNFHSPIGSLKIGDKIRSWDIERNKTQYTSITQIHKYKVWEIVCFNNTISMSSSHPIMTMVKNKDGLFTPKWKASLDVNVGDYIVDSNGEFCEVKSKKYQPYKKGIDVLNLSTDNGSPFIVGNFIVRSDNANDNMEWADTPITQKILLAS